MTSKELVSAALQGHPVPRVPTGPLAVHFCARCAGYTLRQYSTDARILAESVLRYYEQFKPDAIWVSADTWVSAEAMGARVGSPGEDQPMCGLGSPLIQSAKDIERIRPPDLKRRRYPLMLEALDRVVSALGKEVFIVACFDQYPFSLAAALIGASQIMLKISDDPAFVRALMERCEEYAFAYARALDEHGADMLSGGDAPAGLIGFRLYEELALPREQSLIARLKSVSKKPVSLHICGQTTGILPLMAKSGAGVLELDYPVDLAKARQLISSQTGIWGNLDPVGVIAQGTPKTVWGAARQAIAAMKGHSRFVLSSGCTLAVETPAENLRAMLAPLPPDLP